MLNQFYEIPTIKKNHKSIYSHKKLFEREFQDNAMKFMDMNYLIDNKRGTWNHDTILIDGHMSSFKEIFYLFSNEK